MKTYRKSNEQLFSNRRPLSYPNLMKKYENIHKAQTSQKVLTPRHKTIRSTTEVSPWNDQTYKKVQVGNDQEKAQSEKDSYSKNRGGEKNLQ